MLRPIISVIKGDARSLDCGSCCVGSLNPTPKQFPEKVGRVAAGLFGALFVLEQVRFEIERFPIK